MNDEMKEQYKRCTWLPTYQAKLKPHVKEKWLRALRSGEYKQGVGALRNSFDGYCCLGVLCDVHRKSTGNKHQWSEGVSGENELFPGDKSYMGVSDYLPPEVRKWALATSKPYPKDFAVGPTYNRQWLASLNDEGKSFKQIARYIEKYL